MTIEEVRKQMKIAAKLVESWPVWKQNILDQSGRPSVDVPRTPIVVCESEQPKHDKSSISRG